MKIPPMNTSVQLLPSPLKFCKTLNSNRAGAIARTRNRNPIIWCHRILAGRMATGKVCRAKCTDAPIRCLRRAPKRNPRSTSLSYQQAIFLSRSLWFEENPPISIVGRPVGKTLAFYGMPATRQPVTGPVWLGIPSHGSVCVPAYCMLTERYLVKPGQTWIKWTERRRQSAASELEEVAINTSEVVTGGI